MSQLVDVRYSHILGSYVVESPNHKEYVKLTWLDKFLGISLQDKLDKAILNVYKSELDLINAKITAQKLSGVK